jgi:hypothetical protein
MGVLKKFVRIDMLKGILLDGEGKTLRGRENLGKGHDGGERKGVKTRWGLL